ncbi:MAG: hypothetical protein HY738_14395, partial [Bacteroidia bacterium]|nr:hypothetical protein [Bacteroidia bacterium]
MGNKIALKSKKEDFTKTEEDTIQATVKETEEKKNIIGYNCKKAMISLEEITLEVWYTDEISIIEPNWDNGLFKDIKGVLMEYTIEVEGFKMIYTATEVKKGKLKDSIFNIPPGYKEMTREELKNLFSE